MNPFSLSEPVFDMLKKMQQNEADEHEIYKKIAGFVKNEANKAILLRISEEEKTHCEIWGKYTERKLKPNGAKVLWYTAMARIFGYTFAIKLMERGEGGAQRTYRQLTEEVPEAELIAIDEQEHEHELIGMLDEERLQYVGAMVLGLNDALVELTGTLAGLTLALADNRLVALSGLITGISATFSMTASAYLSAKSDGDENAVKSSAYTGVMYLITVAMLVLPYLILPSDYYIQALCSMLVIVTLIILGFNYYISVAKELNFRQRFLEMFAISGSVAALSFVVGLLAKAWLGIDI